MKAFFLLIITFLICFGTSYAQKSKKEPKEKKRAENLSPQARYDAYLQSANNQKLLGWFALGLGSSMVIGGSAKMVSDSFKGVPKTDTRLLWLPVVGTLTAVSSYFIIKKSKEKRKRASMILERESACLGDPQHTPLSFAAVGVRIHID
jgi:hypothetical protein